MKRIITKYFILSVLAVFSLTSCSDYLDKQPDDQLTLEMVFNNKTNTQRWLANIYSYIPDTYSYGTVEPCGDDMVPSPRWEQFNFKVIQYQKGNWNPLSEGGISYWTTLPKHFVHHHFKQGLISLLRVLKNFYREKNLVFCATAAASLNKMALQDSCLILYSNGQTHKKNQLSLPLFFLQNTAYREH